VQLNHQKNMKYVPHQKPEMMVHTTVCVGQPVAQCFRSYRKNICQSETLLGQAVETESVAEVWLAAIGVGFGLTWWSLWPMTALSWCS
jgi:hypothetical protein